MESSVQRKRDALLQLQDLKASLLGRLAPKVPAQNGAEEYQDSLTHAQLHMGSPFTDPTTHDLATRYDSLLRQIPSSGHQMYDQQMYPHGLERSRGHGDFAQHTNTTGDHSQVEQAYLAALQELEQERARRLRQSHAGHLDASGERLWNPATLPSQHHHHHPRPGYPQEDQSQQRHPGPQYPHSPSLGFPLERRDESARAVRAPAAASTPSSRAFYAPPPVRAPPATPPDGFGLPPSAVALVDSRSRRAFPGSPPSPAHYSSPHPRLDRAYVATPAQLPPPPLHSPPPPASTLHLAGAATLPPQPLSTGIAEYAAVPLLRHPVPSPLAGNLQPLPPPEARDAAVRALSSRFDQVGGPSRGTAIPVETRRGPALVRPPTRYSDPAPPHQAAAATVSSSSDAQHYDSGAWSANLPVHVSNTGGTRASGARFSSNGHAPVPWSAQRFQQYPEYAPATPVTEPVDWGRADGGRSKHSLLDFASAGEAATAGVASTGQKQWTTSGGPHGHLATSASRLDYEDELAMLRSQVGQLGGKLAASEEARRSAEQEVERRAASMLSDPSTFLEAPPPPPTSSRRLRHQSPPASARRDPPVVLPPSGSGVTRDSAEKIRRGDESDVGRRGVMVRGWEREGEDEGKTRGLQLGRLHEPEATLGVLDLLRQEEESRRVTEQRLRDAQHQVHHLKRQMEEEIRAPNEAREDAVRIVLAEHSAQAEALRSMHVALHKSQQEVAHLRDQLARIAETPDIERTSARRLCVAESSLLENDELSGFWRADSPSRTPPDSVSKHKYTMVLERLNSEMEKRKAIEMRLRFALGESNSLPLDSTPLDLRSDVPTPRLGPSVSIEPASASTQPAAPISSSRMQNPLSDAALDSYATMPAMNPPPSPYVPIPGSTPGQQSQEYAQQQQMPVPLQPPSEYTNPAIPSALSPPAHETRTAHSTQSEAPNACQKQLHAPAPYRPGVFGQTPSAAHIQTSDASTSKDPSPPSAPKVGRHPPAPKAPPPPPKGPPPPPAPPPKRVVKGKAQTQGKSAPAPPKRAPPPPRTPPPPPPTKSEDPADTDAPMTPFQRARMVVAKQLEGQLARQQADG